MVARAPQATATVVTTARNGARARSPPIRSIAEAYRRVPQGWRLPDSARPVPELLSVGGPRRVRITELRLGVRRLGTGVPTRRSHGCASAAHFGSQPGERPVHTVQAGER